MKKCLCLLGAVSLWALSSCSNDQPLKVKDVKPVASFKANVTTITEGAKVNFTDTSINSPTSWIWIFEGGTPYSSKMQNPSDIVYAKAGKYSVSLSAGNVAGNSGFKEILGYITVTAPVVDPNSVLPKTLKITSKGGGIANTSTATFTYDGKKIKSITLDAPQIGDDKFTHAGDNIMKKMFTYTGNTITKVENFDKNNKLINTINLTYENGKLKSWDDGSRRTYTYDPNGTDVTKYSTYYEDPPEFKYKLDANGNIITITTTRFTGRIDTSLYTYDSKNSPYKNILGYNLLMEKDYFTNFQEQNGINNHTHYVSNITNWGNQLSEEAVYEDLQYDSNNFLVKSTRRFKVGDYYTHDPNVIRTFEYTY